MGIEPTTVTPPDYIIMCYLILILIAMAPVAKKFCWGEASFPVKKYMISIFIRRDFFTDTLAIDIDSRAIKTYHHRLTGLIVTREQTNGHTYIRAKNITLLLDFGAVG